MNDKKKLELISKLVNIGLNYNVEDYVYILQDIEKILNNIEIKVDTKNYIY